MTLTDLFKDLSDGILIINKDGNVNYYNKPASKLIHGETIDTIGLERLQMIMPLVLNGELSTPIRFIETTYATKEYSVKIISMYSFYIVQFIDTKRPIN
jgi:transcriptional regulator with PAS, ATPase and Fis domain